jgi:hydroxymethylpyrimidine/phosphomethylpyrimidine kinase
VFCRVEWRTRGRRLRECSDRTSDRERQYEDRSAEASHIANIIIDGIVHGVTPIPIALTIAGSDPSGGAGIQADLKTFSKLNVYGMAVITALTAQNTIGVSAVQSVAGDFVAQQLDAVLTDLPPMAVKTGMLLTAEVVEVVGAKLKQYAVPNLVVDPVMISTSGSRLLNSDAVTAFRRVLLPLATLLTPNLDEAAALASSSLSTIEDLEEAARKIHSLGPKFVLIKGGHLPGDEATDVLFDGHEIRKFRSARIVNRNTHGTGCVLSASIAAYLSLGKSMRDAISLGKEFVTHAIRNGLAIGQGTGPCDPLDLRR